MNPKNRKRLIDYAKVFGEVKFDDYNFEDPYEIKLATLELIATKKLAEGLVAEINSHLTIEAGYRAYLNPIMWHEGENKRYKYIVEITPYDFVPRLQWEEASEEVLHSLPRLLKNFRMKNPSENRKRRRFIIKK